MKLGLKHKRIRCESCAAGIYLADDYDIVSLFDGTKVGECELRYASILTLPYTGNVSFTVFKAYRGRRIATEAVRLLLEYAEEHQMEQVWITAAKDNLATVRVCQKLGACFVDEISVCDDPIYQERGIESIRRYRIDL